jgi:hypothetical protein
MRHFRFMAIVVLLLACVVLGSACGSAKGGQAEKGEDGVGIQEIVNNPTVPSHSSLPVGSATLRTT